MARPIRVPSVTSGMPTRAPTKPQRAPKAPSPAKTKQPMRRPRGRG